MCLNGGYRVASRAVSFASPTALWAAPFANLLCLLAVAILRWACPGGWWNSALAAAQHFADDDAGEDKDSHRGCEPRGRVLRLLCCLTCSNLLLGRQETPAHACRRKAAKK